MWCMTWDMTLYDIIVIKYDMPSDMIWDMVLVKIWGGVISIEIFLYVDENKNS